MSTTEKYTAYTLSSLRKIPQIDTHLSAEQKFALEVVGHVLPFKTNNYVVNELIDWKNVLSDPIFTLTFPREEMLLPHHFNKMADVLKAKSTTAEIKAVAHEIRTNLNPHPDGQLEHNVPTIHGTRLTGIQHKYRETLLFFPSHGQTCHAYCTFCFRWPQFVGIDELKFAMRETDLLIQYLQAHPNVTDVLFTGGDPLIMSADRLNHYLTPLLEADLPGLQTIRLGTKALGYWPYRFLSDKDSDDLMRLFEKVVRSGKHLAFMAHFNHPVELAPPEVAKAIARIRNTGAEIRTQSPIMRHINDSAQAWRDLWNEQAKLGCIPYYMFVARDTGAQHYFALPLVQAWSIFRRAYQQVSGITRTVRGPSMSTDPGKVQVLGVSEIKNEKVMVLRFLQGRNPDWVHRPFFAKYNAKAIWLDELEPAFGETQFFYEEEHDHGMAPEGHQAVIN